MTDAPEEENRWCSVAHTKHYTQPRPHRHARADSFVSLLLKKALCYAALYFIMNNATP